MKICQLLLVKKGHGVLLYNKNFYRKTWDTSYSCMIRMVQKRKKVRVFLTFQFAWIFLPSKPCHLKHVEEDLYHEISRDHGI